MPKCFICNKCIYLYIYICLIQFVVNEKNFFLRYKGGEQEWEFTLDLDTEGGQVLYNRLKEKNIILSFIVSFKRIWFPFNDTFTSFYKNLTKRGYPNKIGDILATLDKIEIKESLSDNDYTGVEIIGNVKNFSWSKFDSLVGDEDYYLYLELVLVEKPDASKKLKKLKSSNWKTVKILKKLKALKRYRLMKRLKY